MAGSVVALVLFGLAVSSALPQSRQQINWPERPSFWPENLPWPPSDSENWPERPSWWPRPNWPPTVPDTWPEQPSWWPDLLPWPPARPEGWPDQPEWWPQGLPWPPPLPEQWPEQPSWWPDGIPWPPARPEEWPEQPSWWPNDLPWPPARPENWPERPSWWPEALPWPPALPEERPSWWPESLPWPPAIPDAWPERPSWWPESLPWPPQFPDLGDITWPPPGVSPDLLPYLPSRDNSFHLFTRQNPSKSQPLVINNAAILRNSYFNPAKRTIVLIHGHQEQAISMHNAILNNAFLQAADVNIIVVDWATGAAFREGVAALFSVFSGNFVSRFLNFVADTTGADFADFHLVGVGLGGLNAGFVGLRLNRQVGYITALDPPQGHEVSRFIPALSVNAGQYVEAIYTDVEGRGYSQPLAHANFYPNRGSNQPGCGGQSDCNRSRSVYFFAESVQTGGFTSIECGTWRDALEGNCHGPGTSNLGGLLPKTGTRGNFFLTTNANVPFSRG